jgi:multidrug resistance efflux pump
MLDSPHSMQTPGIRTRGFPQAQLAEERRYSPPSQGVHPPVRPHALPHAPKGAWLTRIFYLAMVTGILWIARSLFQGTPPHGYVDAKCHDMVTSHAGVVESVEVRDGDWVAAGELLCKISYPELQRNCRTLEHELHSAETRKSVELAQAEIQLARQESERLQAIAEYHVAEGDLGRETFEVQRLEHELQRNRSLAERHVVTDESFDQIQFATRGQSQRLLKLADSVEHLRARAEGSKIPQGLPDAIARDWDARIETIRQELSYVKEQLRTGEVKAPCAGRIMACQIQPRQALIVSSPLFEFMPLNALELVVYVSEREVDDYPPGSQVVVRRRAGDQSTWEVSHTSPRFAQLPAFVRHRHTKKSPLVAIHCRPSPSISCKDLEQIRLGESLAVQKIQKVPLADIHALENQESRIP